MSTIKYSPPENHYIQLDIAFATAYGVNEALLFDKLYRLQNQFEGKVDDKGNKWVRLTYDEWEKEIPFLSRNTIIRTTEHLEETGIFLSSVFFGRSKWYRCNPEYIQSTQNEQTHLPKMGKPSTQNGKLPNSSPNSSPNKKNGAQRPPAVDTYRKIANRFPDKATWSMLAEVTDLEFWEQVVTHYIACGWSKVNIKTMLEFYNRRELPKVNRNGHKTNHKMANQAEVDGETQKRGQQLAAAFEKRKK